MTTTNAPLLASFRVIQLRQYSPWLWAGRPGFDSRQGQIVFVTTPRQPSSSVLCGLFPHDYIFRRVKLTTSPISVSRLRIRGTIPHSSTHSSDVVLDYTVRSFYLGGLVVSVLAPGPTGHSVAGSNPTEDGGFLWAIKIPSTHFLLRGSKAVGPMSYIYGM
jgi:hypothetical protein